MRLNILPLKAQITSDVALVSLDFMLIHFHINTKLASMVELFDLAPVKHDYNGSTLDIAPLWLEWQIAASDFVACLPRKKIPSGASGEEMDPYRGSRSVFRSNRIGRVEDIPMCLEKMYTISKPVDDMRDEHMHLMEICHRLGYVYDEELNNFGRFVYGGE